MPSRSLRRSTSDGCIPPISGPWSACARGRRLLMRQCPQLGRTCLGFNVCDEPGAAQEASAGSAAHEGASGEPARGITPPAAPRTVREPLGSHRSRCSTVSMIQGPMSEEAWPCAAKPLKLVLGTLRPACHPLVFAAGPSNDTRQLFGR